MTQTQKRLETALLEFIETAVEERDTEEIQAVPAAAFELIKLWKQAGEFSKINQEDARTSS